MDFNPKYKGQNVFSQFSPQSHITYDSAIMRYIEVAHWDNMSYQEFRNQDVEYQSLLAAAFDSKHKAEAVKSWKERSK